MMGDEGRPTTDKRPSHLWLYVFGERHDGDGYQYSIRRVKNEGCLWPASATRKDAQEAVREAAFRELRFLDRTERQVVADINQRRVDVQEALERLRDGRDEYGRDDWHDDPSSEQPLEARDE